MIVEDRCTILQTPRVDKPHGVDDPHKAEQEARRAQASRDELVELIERAVREDGTVEPLQGLHLHRSSLPREPLHSVYDPVFCVVAQGSKEVFLGSERYQYDPPRASMRFV